MPPSPKEDGALAGVYLPLFLRAYYKMKIAALLSLSVQPPKGTRR